MINNLNKRNMQKHQNFNHSQKLSQKLSSFQKHLSQLENLYYRQSIIFENGTKALRQLKCLSSSSEEIDDQSIKEFSRQCQSRQFKDDQVSNQFSYSKQKIGKQDNESKISEISRKQDHQVDITIKKSKKKKPAKLPPPSSSLKLDKGSQSVVKNKSKPGPKMFHDQSQTLKKKTQVNKSQIFTKNAHSKYSCLNLSPKCFSPNQKNHLNLEKQIVLKINKLRAKKNLCQMESLYLESSLRVTQKQIEKVTTLIKNYSQESMLNTYMVKSAIKFLSQFWAEIYELDLGGENCKQDLIKTLGKPKKLIKVINKLPQLIRRNGALSEQRCKELFAEQQYVTSRISTLNKCYIFQSPLYSYLQSLHNYVEFLLNNHIIHETKRLQIITLDQELLFSDRSTRQTKAHEKYECGSERKKSRNKLVKIETFKQLRKEGKLKKVKK